jgi:TPR repeat protein
MSNGTVNIEAGAVSMTDRDKLPVKTTTESAVVPAEQSGSLVARGLEAIQNRQADAENLFRDALGAYRRGNFAEAVKGFRKAADQGHAVAQFNLGVMYNKGHGVEKNERETVAWVSQGGRARLCPRAMQSRREL